MGVLFVCTANVCRSPMAEALWHARLAELAPAEGLRAASAGTAAVAAPPAPRAVRAVAERGAHVPARPGRRVTPALLAAEGDELVLTMERAHVRALVALDESVYARTFTLREFVRRATAAGPRRAGEPVGAYVARLAAGRTRLDVFAGDHGDDVADPIDRSMRHFRRCAEELDVLVRAALVLLRP